jgi:hypothetical protein
MQKEYSRYILTLYVCTSSLPCVKKGKEKSREDISFSTEFCDFYTWHKETQEIIFFFVKRLCEHIERQM